MAIADNERRLRSARAGYEYQLKTGEWLTPGEMGERCDVATQTISNRLTRHTPEKAMSLGQRVGTVSPDDKLPDNMVLSTSRRGKCVPGDKPCDHYEDCWLSFGDPAMVRCVGYQHTQQEA